MRLFVALDLDDVVRERIAKLLVELRQGRSDIKWVRPESLHLTLKFIGEQPENKLETIAEALEHVPRPGPLDVGFRTLGCFPNERRPRVFWVGVQASPALAELAAAVDSALEPLGMEREKRPFAPHLTLGRAREGGPPPQPPAAWNTCRQEDFGTTAAAHFYLYLSRLSPGGAQYARLRQFPLKSPV